MENFFCNLMVVKLIYVHDFGRKISSKSQNRGQVDGTCKCGSETSGSIKCWEFPDELRTG
jgi:hypothetical protein